MKDVEIIRKTEVYNNQAETRVVGDTFMDRWGKALLLATGLLIVAPALLVGSVLAAGAVFGVDIQDEFKPINPWDSKNPFDNNLDN